MHIDGASAGLIVLVAGAAVLIYLRRRRHVPVRRLAAVTLLMTYATGVAAFTLFPIRLDAAYVSRPPFDPAIVLELFFLGRPDAMSPAQYAANVLLGVPFGFLAPFVWSWSLPKVVAAGVGFSLLIEAMQWLLTKLMVAFPSRAVDVNDVVLNTLGVVIGVLGCALVRSAFARRPPAART